MTSYANRLVTTVSAVASAGLGAFTISTASSSYRTFVAGDDGKTFDVSIVEGTAWEVRTGCVYTHSGTSLARGTLEASSTGSAIAFTTAAVLTVTPTAATYASVDNFLGAWGALLGENSITTTANAVIGRLNVCTGTTADYTVTLPAVSGNSGKYIGFRMDAALTKLVTLDGNASETIDGALTRIMWAQETALLYCNGTTWTKVAGKTIPMAVVIKRTTDQSITTGVWTAITFTAKDSGTDFMWDSGNGRVTIVRAGNYDATGKSYMTCSAIAGSHYLACVPNAVTPPGAAQESYTAGSGVQFATPMGSASMSVGGYINGSVYCSITSAVIKGSVNASFLHVNEVPQW